MSLFIILIGIGIILLGYFFHKKHKDLERTCTMQTTGEVIQMDRREETHTETDDDGHRTTRTTTTYYPVFQYAVNGRSIQKTSSTGTGRPRFSEGQSITILYDPENPERYFVAEDKAAGRFGIYFMAFGAVVFIIGIVSLFVPFSR